ncbi:ABC transporter permease [Halorubrum sp. DM2]|uniref:ABC transporter permease n=1 Tax=Halorubrum sp. DM2 TaxID=2527867 RepID=UPI0024B75D02|nr:ABC transporter permease [Halorubrum sp. DM2]
MDSASLSTRFRRRPLPAVTWTVGAAVLIALELGRVAGSLAAVGSATAAAGQVAVGWTRTGLASGGASAVVAIAFVGVVVWLVGLAASAGTGSDLVRSVTARLPPAIQRTVEALIYGGLLLAAGWVATQIGAVEVAHALGRALGSLADLPTLTAREVIPNQGYQLPDGTWQGTFLGLSPAAAWGLRVLVVHAYVIAWLGWGWLGYRWFRAHYRRADWTPRDEVVRRFRGHRWGQFGLVVVGLFLTMALFAPSLGTTPAEQNLYSPFSHTIQYYDADVGGVAETLVGNANAQTRSVGYPMENVGPGSYDQFDRFHPFGTLTDGKDLFTFLVHGARVSLVVGLLSVGTSTVIAAAFALISAYYRGVADLLLVVTSDTVMGVPRLLLLILLTVLLADTSLAGAYNGGVLLALILAATGWPFLWRAFRGPALQVSEKDWVDAARNYGQSPTGIMRYHMLPYLVGYLLIYSSLVLGGVILAIAGLSFLGLGITPPTPEWGRAVDMGREYVATESWHISLIPGAMVTLVVIGFNAVGDALRDAVDPQSDTGATDASETESRGGGV